MATDFKDLGRKLRLLSKQIERIPVAFLAANEAEGVFRSRVWGPGGAEDIHGNKLPTYSESYIKYNKFGKKKTTSTWDLQAEGDLSGSLHVVDKKNTAVLEIIGAEQVKKADSLEERSGKTIFELSASEEKEVLNATIREVGNLINIAVNKIFK